MRDALARRAKDACESSGQICARGDLWRRGRTWAERGGWYRSGVWYWRRGWCRRGQIWAWSRFYEDLRQSNFFVAGTIRAAGVAGLYSGVRVGLRIGASRGIYSRLCSHCRVATRANFALSCAGHPNGVIVDPHLHTKDCRGVCSGIRVRSDIYSTPGIYLPGLCGSG